jgi:energy-coupling factor transporter ATP-binding protein EcfA2
MKNPFLVSFRKIGENYIQNDYIIQPIFDDFDAEPTRNTIYILTGPRGCGKTVTLSHILDIYHNKNNWVVARLTQSENMLEQMASLLYENGLIKIKSFKVEFSFSFHGFTFSVKGDKPATSIHTYLKIFLNIIKRKI